MLSDSHADFQGRSATVFAVTILFTVLCTLFVSLRIISRAAIVRKISVDDYLIVLAWVIAVGIAVTICYGCAWGLGRHESDIPAAWQENMRRADYVFSVLYQPALMALKTSILAFYLSLPTINKNFKWACIATLVVVNAGGLALGLFTVFQCSPVGAAFQVPQPSNSQCTDIITIYLSSTPLNIITDLALLFLPMPILTGMRLPRKQKIILVITFSFGAFVAAVDVVRVVYLQSASTTRLEEIHQGTHSNGSRDDRTDASWYTSFSFMWSAIEVNVGIMVACVPGLKPIVSRFLPYMLRDRGELSTSDSANRPVYNDEVKASPPLPAMVIEDVDFPDDSNNDPMGMLDFLTTPEMTELPQLTSSDTARPTIGKDDRKPSNVFFDFIDMERQKSLLNLTARESFFPIMMVTVLFFIWGFAYGLLEVLNQQFQRVAHMSATQSTSIHSAYYAGYFFGPILVGRLVLKHWGFKACYTVGLAIYGCGTLIYWPAAVLTSFPAFVVTNFIVAFGLSMLEVSANPFIALCGPPQYNEVRLNLSQGVQAIGSVIAPLIAEKAFFHQTFHGPSLLDTQWAYLGISLFTILLAVGYYYVPLPEATDEQLQAAAEQIDVINNDNPKKIGNIDFIWLTLAFGVFSQFCYVGAQEVNGTVFDTYLTAIAPLENTVNYMAIAHTAFAVSRFLAAGLAFWVNPRILMLVCFMGAIIFEALAMKYEGSTGTAMIMMVFFFEGPLFSLIFAQALRGMGRHTKIASVFITAAISGGAVFAPISNRISLSATGGVRYSLVVAVAVFAAGTLFPVLLNVSPVARRQCDPPPKVEKLDDIRASSAGSAWSRRWSFLHGRTTRGDNGDDSNAAEWKERPSTE